MVILTPPLRRGYRTSLKGAWIDDQTGVAYPLRVTPLLKSTSEYWKDISREWKGVRRSLDADSVHDLRVASRRAASSILLLESVLGVNRPVKCRRRIKRLLKKLGALRDVQVQISIVEKWKPSRLVTEFLDSLRQFEKDEGRAVRKYLNASRRKKIRRSLKTLERRATPLLKSTTAGTIKRRIEETLNARRADLRAVRADLMPSDPQKLHALRVAAKKLRYCLEAALPLVGAAPKTELQQLHWYQTRLGHMRDVQILNEKFQQWKNQRAA
jgi:CHAD domain-containing protein